MKNTLEPFIEKVRQEIKRQEDKWGKDRNNHPAVWMTILTEEVGEVAQEICDSGFEIEKLSDNYETELIQVAAVCLSALMNIEKYKID